MTFKEIWDFVKGDISSSAPKKGPPPKTPSIPSSRSSYPTDPDLNQILGTFENKNKVIDMGFARRVIPLMRQLSRSNPDVSQALQNVVNLGNTGHKIQFDKKVDDAYADKMRDHIENKHKQWAAGQAGADGLINRFFSQLQIAGALSFEIVANKDLNGIDTILMVAPESIYWVLTADRIHYEAYQKINSTSIAHSMVGTTVGMADLKKLNPFSYKYYALNGDGEEPYGFPPYLASLKPLCTQHNMNESIDRIIAQLGLLGFLEVLITAPDQQDGESDEAYGGRLSNLLLEAKNRVESGIKDGTMVGLKDQHEFEFKSIAREFTQVVELYKQNELQVASALKQDATLWGRDYNTSESQISIIFMKLLAELKNSQNIIKTAWEFIYKTELQLSGFTFDTLRVQFNHSTIQDDLKYQQAREIKIRNLIQEYIMGTISEYQFANELDRENPDQTTPRVPIEILAGVAPKAEQEQKREAQKDESDKSVRSKNKPQGAKKQ